MDPATFGAIISNAGGFGSHLRHYGQLLAFEPECAVRAEVWPERLVDLHEWLVRIGFRAPMASSLAAGPRVSQHASCRLAHGQKITREPRAVFRSLPGVDSVECPEATWCCGSAGIYNITQPETVAWLQERKVNTLRVAGAVVVATANPGCHLQIENGLRAKGLQSLRGVHPVVLLAEAYPLENVQASRVSG